MEGWVAMTLHRSHVRVVLVLGVAVCALAQRPGGFGGRGGFGAVRQPAKLLDQFDKDGKGYLNAAERKAAREYLAQNSWSRTGGFGRSRFGGVASGQPPTAGPKLSPADVKSYSSADLLYDPKVLRTLFLQFEEADWERELADFKNTDVEVPATLIVDGRTYRDVGVHFHGNTSYSNVPEGYKRSMNLSVDLVNKDQRVYGYRTIHLLNSAADQTFLRTVLYMQVARSYIPAPKANYVRLVINGESWGVYQNVQQFNTDFTAEFFGTKGGARWKVPGSPNGRGGLAYIGDDPAPYKRIYEIKSKDDPKSWADLITLCRVLNQTPPEQLEKALEPILDVDGALRFLAVDKALINNDGYWTRASDYDIYEDDKGRFHVVPYDSNETFRPTEGFGGGPWGGGGGGLVTLDPYAGASDPNKALLYRLLSAPVLEERYLSYLRDIAEKWLDWNRIGLLAEQYQALIAPDVQSDNRKLASTEAFTKGLSVDGQGGGYGPIAYPGMSLKSFVEQRRAYLLNYPDIKKLARQTRRGSL